MDEDGFKAWLGDLQVAEAVAGGGMNQQRQQAVAAGRNHAQAVGGYFGAVRAVRRLSWRRAWLEPFPNFSGRMAGSRVDVSIRARRSWISRKTCRKPNICRLDRL